METENPTGRGTFTVGGIIVDIDRKGKEKGMDEERSGLLLSSKLRSATTRTAGTSVGTGSPCRYFFCN